MIWPGSGTVRARFTVMYAIGFLACSLGLLALTNLVSAGTVDRTLPAGSDTRGGLGQAQQRIRVLTEQLNEIEAEQSRRLLTASLLALVVMVVVSLALGRLLAHHALRPLRVITSTTRRISADSLDRRLAVTGPGDEVKDLADTIDGLLARLESSFEAQRRFVANASHELRTPLTTMRASLDVAVGKPDPAGSTVALADRMRRELDRVDHLLDGLLTLARARHGALDDRTPIDLSGLVRSVLRTRAIDARHRGLTVTSNLQAQTLVRGVEPLLERLVDNLVDNAVKHNADDGWIDVTTTMTDAQAELVVSTGGRVLDQSEVNDLTQPFRTLGAERTGSSGLGLSIVAAIATAHDGRLLLVARPEGGLRVSVRLPGFDETAPA